MTVPFIPRHDTWPHLRRDGDAWTVARLVGKRIDGLCMVTGVTPAGARLMTVLEINVGDEIALDLGGETRFAAQVRWVEGGVAGIGFARPVIGGEGTGKGMPRSRESRRRPPRFHRCVPVTLERHGREQTGELVDISQFGACIAAPAQPWLRLGSGVVLQIEGCDTIDAEVRWLEDGRVGLAFHSHVHLRKFDKHLKEWARSCSGCTREDCDARARGAFAGDPVA
jgi:hypothetical protein